MLNHIVIMGRLTRDPELRRTGSGTAVAGFTVAVDRDFAAQGQEKETDFIDCVAWAQKGEFVAKYFTKGSMIVVSGRLQIRGWTDKDGNKRRSAEVVADNCYFGESKGRSEGRPAAQNSYPSYGNVPAYTPPATYQQPVQPSVDEYPELLGYDANNPFGGDDFDQLDF